MFAVDMTIPSIDSFYHLFIYSESCKNIFVTDLLWGVETPSNCYSNQRISMSSNIPAEGVLKDFSMVVLTCWVNSTLLLSKDLKCTYGNSTYIKTCQKIHGHDCSH